MRNSAAIDEELEESRGSRNKRGKNPPPQSSASGIQRSKTLAGRKLRVMTVEKGLLRETKIVQRMVDSLVDCRVRPCAFSSPSDSSHALARSSTSTTSRTNLTSPRCGCW